MKRKHTNLNKAILITKRVDKLWYLGDMLSALGGADASSITRIRTGWKKFRELPSLLTLTVFSHKMKDNIYKACVRSAMLYDP